VGALDVTEPPRLCAGVLVLVLVGDVVVPVGVGDGDTDGDELGVTDGVGVSEGKMSIGRMSSANAAGAKAPITSIVQATNTQHNNVDRRRGLAIPDAFPAGAILNRNARDRSGAGQETCDPVPPGTGAAQSSGRWSGMMKSHGSTSRPSCLCRA
jgi:hypothetical protein